MVGFNSSCLYFATYLVGTRALGKIDLWIDSSRDPWSTDDIVRVLVRSPNADCIVMSHECDRYRVGVHYGIHVVFRSILS